MCAAPERQEVDRVFRPAPSTRDPSERLWGRDSELTALGEALDALLSGTGTVVVVAGLAGMGKTRLLDEAADMARRLSIRVGRGTADPADSVVQLAPLMEALFTGPTPILERHALDAAHTSPDQRYWLLQDLEELLERATRDTPLLICLDDLHWADSGTAAALRMLPARLATVPVGWVVAARSGSGSPEVRRALDHLERDGGVKIPLAPLDDAAVARLATDLLTATPDQELLELIDRAGGSPYLLVDLLSGLRDEQLVQIEDGQATLVQSGVPDRVTQGMSRRLDRASELGRQVATIAASLGRRFSLDDLARMLDLAPASLLLPVEELIDCDVFVDRDHQLAFSHDLTLEAVRASVPLAVRRALDRQAAVVLLEGGALPVEVAVQLAESAEPGDELAITTLLKAAEALGATDPGTAADLGQCALELAPPNHPLRGPLVAGTAVWLHAAERSEEAKTFADTALRQALPPLQEAEVRLSIAGMFAISPDVRAESARQALMLPGVSAELRSRHLAVLFHNLVTAGRTSAAGALLDEATAAVEATDDIPARFVLLLAESALSYADGQFERALELAEAAVRTSTTTSDETRAHLARQWQCDVLMMVDCLEEALVLSGDHMATAQRYRHAWALQNLEKARARLLLQLGRISDAAAVLRDQYGPDATHRVVSVPDASAVGALGRIAIHLGDEGQSRHVAKIARAMVEEAAPSVRRHGAWLLALQAMAEGDPARAHRWLCHDGAEGRTLVLPLFPMDVSDEARLVHIALAVQDDELGASAVAAVQDRARRNPGVPSHSAAAAHARGVFERSRTELTRAVELYDAGLRPLAFAAALEDLGIVAVDEGATDAGIDAFSRALVVYAECGAAWDAGRLRGRLRALGVRRRLVAAQRPERGWAAMTDSELAVARLVAEGLTNREVAERLFVSRHTVSGHLRSVFLKLAVNSRVELTRLAGEYDSGS